jgi:hypothetical protein
VYPLDGGVQIRGGGSRSVKKSTICRTRKRSGKSYVTTPVAWDRVLYFENRALLELSDYVVGVIRSAVLEPPPRPLP